jgi:hypothetical protein
MDDSDDYLLMAAFVVILGLGGLVLPAGAMIRILDRNRKKRGV